MIWRIHSEYGHLSTFQNYNTTIRVGNPSTRCLPKIAPYCISGNHFSKLFPMGEGNLLLYSPQTMECQATLRLHTNPSRLLFGWSLLLKNLLTTLCSATSSLVGRWWPWLASLSRMIAWQLCLLNAMKCPITPDLLEMPLGAVLIDTLSVKKHMLLEAHILSLVSGGGRLF